MPKANIIKVDFRREGTAKKLNYAQVSSIHRKQSKAPLDVRIIYYDGNQNGYTDPIQVIETEWDADDTIKPKIEAVIEEGRKMGAKYFQLILPSLKASSPIKLIRG